MKKHVYAGVVAQNTLTRPLILISGLLHTVCLYAVFLWSLSPPTHSACVDIQIFLQLPNDYSCAFNSQTAPH